MPHSVFQNDAGGRLKILVRLAGDVNPGESCFDFRRQHSLVADRYQKLDRTLRGCVGDHVALNSTALNICFGLKRAIRIEVDYIGFLARRLPSNIGRVRAVELPLGPHGQQTSRTEQHKEGDKQAWYMRHDYL